MPPLEQGQRGILPTDAISPLDGRYAQDVDRLRPFFSEGALIRTRFEIEGLYLIALSDIGIIRPLQDEEKKTLRNFGPGLSDENLERVKQIENETKHDVKAMERTFRELLTGTSLSDLTEMIHFGLTSEDINNLSYRLMLQRAVREVCLPSIDSVVDGLVDRAEKYQDIPMLARTHGQPAVPTTLGKEFAVFATRLNSQVEKLFEMRLTGKLNGAVGNFNALALVYPDIDWLELSENFVASLGLKPNLVTTQINPYEDMIEMFQVFQRINGIILDLDQDMWRYVSDDWFVQEARKGEVGSSVMPQKINPINFENSEGNLQIANSLFDGMDRKLSVSRLQRDLSDSTTIRNIGVAISHSFVAYQNTIKGLERINPNIPMLTEELNNNWTILAEGVQTLLRRERIEDPYTLITGLAKGQRIGPDEWHSWVDSLPVGEEIKSHLFALTPQSYIGLAKEITQRALTDIKISRERRKLS